MGKVLPKNCIALILYLMSGLLFEANCLPDYDNKLIPYRKGSKIGYSDANKNIVIPPEFDNAYPFDRGLGMVQNRGKLGFVDAKGRIIIPIIYEMAGYFSNEMVWGVFDRKLFLICKTNINSRKFIKHTEEHVFQEFKLVEGLASVEMNDKYGFVDKHGEMAIPAIFQNARDFSESLALVKKNGKFGFIDKKGKIRVPFIYENASSFAEGLAFVKRGADCSYINRRNRLMIGHFVCDEAEGFKEGRAVVRINEKYGLIDLAGQLVVKPTYDAVFALSEGLALIVIDDKFGFIDENGKMVIQPKYDHAQSFSEGLAVVRIGDKEGYVNKAGELIIPAKYKVAGIFENGLASVINRWQWFYIAKDGTEFVE